MPNQDLPAADLDRPGEADWERAAAVLLRKSGLLGSDDPDTLVRDRLTRTTLDGIGISPLGTAATAAGRPDGGQPGQAPFTRGVSAVPPESGWHIRTQLSDPSASASAADALSDLENGATSLWLTLGRTGIALADLDRVLERVYVDLAPIVLHGPEDPLAAAEAFAALLDRRSVSPAPGTNLGADLYSWALQGSATAPLGDVARRIAELATSHGVLGFVVDATAVHDLGASDAQELGYATAVGAAYLRQLTAPDGAALDVDTAASLLEFRFSATVEELPTVAKLRAARRLWSRVCELSGVSTQESGQRQHAVTSGAMMTANDPWVNMLRVTVAAFAAGIGGAQAITVLPFDAALGLPDGFSRRIARNTCSLLIAESHVAKVVDPAGGAYVVEQLTDDLAQAGWAELQSIERAGGVLAAVRDGSLRTRIDDVAARRDQAIALRERPITGVSEFPHLHERLPQPKPYPAGPPSVRRYSAAYEALRSEPAPAPVFLATMGPVAAHTARATFAGNLLAAGGVDTVGAGSTADVADVLAAYTGQRVVCLAGTDRTYAEWGADVVAALRRGGAAYVVLAGEPGPRTVAAGLVDDSCARGIDALAFLNRIREELSR